MFKSAKRKASQKREKVDFKFEFHVSRVPQEGWDKLIVSLISLESGKITAKTAKASVQNGRCEWADPILGSTKFLQDTNGKEAENGKFKLLVSTGSSRMDILGETTINLAEHACTSVPTSLNLPLQNGNSGSILHVIIHCLNPKVAYRTLGKDVSLGSTDADEEIDSISRVDNSSVLSIHKDSVLISDDFSVSMLGTSSESIGEIPALVGERLTTSNEKTSSFLPESVCVEIHECNGSNNSGMRKTMNEANFQQLSNDKTSSFLSESTCEERQKFNVTVTDLSGTNKSRVSQAFRDSETCISSSESPSAGVTNTSMPEYASELSHDLTEIHMDDVPGMLRLSSQGNSPQSIVPQGSDRPLVKSHRRSNSVSPRGEAAETTLEELQRDAASWEQCAQKASSEVDRLKQQLSAETILVSKMASELVDLRVELETIKIDTEQLKSIKRSPGNRGHEQDKVNLEMEDARNTIKELKEELAYEKSANLSLNLQLQKTNESNSELLLEIQDLEETLQRRHKEVEEFKAHFPFVKEKEQNDRNEDMKISLVQKLQDSQNEQQQSQERIVLLKEMERREAATDKNELEREVMLLKNELDELERDSQELTEENMNLFIQLKEADNKINSKETVIAQLESKLAIISEYCFSTKAISDQIFVFIDLPEIQAEKLRAIVINLTEKLSLLEELSCSHSATNRAPLDDLDSSAMELCPRNAQLEMQLKCSEENLSSLMKELDAMRNKTSEHEKERALLASQKGQLKCLREKVAQTTENYENALRRAESLELTLTVFREETNQVINTLQSQLTSSAEKLAETGDDATDLRTEIAETLAENAKLSGQLSLLLVAKEKAEISANAMEKVNRDFQEQVELAENKSSRALQQLYERETEIGNLLRDLETTGEQLKNMVNQLAEMESSRDESERRLHNIQEENMVGNLHIKDLEHQLLDLKDVKESLNRSISALEKKSWELQLENTELSEKLQATLASSDDAMRKIESLSSEIKALRAEMESNTTKSLLENQVLDLERSNQILQEQRRTMMEASLQQEENMNDLQARFRLSQDEKDAAMSQVQEVQNDKIELEAVLQMVIQQQGEEIEQVQFELSESVKEANKQKKIVWELETCLEKLKTEIASRTVLCNGLESQLQKARDDCSAMAFEVTTSNDKIERLQIDREEKEKQLWREMEALRYQTEEIVKRNQTQKFIFMETLQQVQKAFHFDDEENFAMQEHYKTSQLMADIIGSQETLCITHHNTEALALQEDIDPIVQEAKKHLFAMAGKLKETLQEFYELKKEKLLDKQIAQAEDKLAFFDNEKNTCADLQVELETAKITLHEMKLEKLLVETSLQKVSSDNARLTEELANWKETTQYNEEAIGGIKNSKVALEGKVPLIQEHNVKGAKKSIESEHKNELTRLRRQITELKRRFLEQEEDKEGFKKKFCTLEEELKRKNGLLVVTEKKLKEKEREIKLSLNGIRAPPPAAKSLSRPKSKVGPLCNPPSSRDAKEMADLGHKFKLLEEELKIKSVELEATKYVLREKEAELCNKIQRMELEKENSIVNCTDNHFERLQKELNSLENQNVALCQREHELLSKVSSQEVLQNEIERLKEEKQQLQNDIIKFHEDSTEGNIQKRVETLEVALAEALEASSMYKSQLERFGSTEQVMNDLSAVTRRNTGLEQELIEMRDKYSQMSLQFAELEAERETLVMAVRNMRDARENNKSKTF